MSAKLPPLPKKDIYRVIDGELDAEEYARQLAESTEGVEDVLKTIEGLRSLLGRGVTRRMIDRLLDGAIAFLALIACLSVIMFFVAIAVLFVRFIFMG